MQNPFDAWSAPSSSRRSSDIPPSIYGALPYTDVPAVPGITTFHFACLNPSIINSVILGPDNCPKFHVVTEPSMPGYTILKAVDGGNIGMIQWKPDDSQVEIRGVMRKRAARDFLILSDDHRSVLFSPTFYGLIKFHRYRVMRVGGTDYIWTSEQGSTCVSSSFGQVQAPCLIQFLSDVPWWRCVVQNICQSHSSPVVLSISDGC